MARARRFPSFLTRLVLVFAGFVLTTPFLSQFVTPCLADSETPYRQATCNVGIALDKYVLMHLIAVVTILIWTYARMKKRRIVYLGILGILLASMTIGSYYAYIPTVIDRIGQASVILNPDDHTFDITP